VPDVFLGGEQADVPLVLLVFARTGDVAERGEFE
jgi:hypothetical protein